jgi:hypothetical protein
MAASNCWIHIAKDSITRSLGKLIEARVENGALVGVIKFHATKDGEQAAELIEDKKDKFDISIAYDTQAVDIYDAKNALVNPNDTERANEPGISFEIAEWTICALGLLRTNEADRGKVGTQDRAYHSPVAPDVARVFARMAAAHVAMVEANSDQRLASRTVKPEINVSIFDDHDHHRDIVFATRARMRAAQKLIECSNDGWRDITMPSRDMIYFGKPESL